MNKREYNSPIGQLLISVSFAPNKGNDGVRLVNLNNI
jgi:hypothetical protein